MGRCVLPNDAFGRFTPPDSALGRFAPTDSAFGRFAPPDSAFGGGERVLVLVSSWTGMLMTALWFYYSRSAICCEDLKV